MVWGARGGAVLDHAKGDYHHGEMRLLHQLLPILTPEDLATYDRTKSQSGLKGRDIQATRRNHRYRAAATVKPVARTDESAFAAHLGLGLLVLFVRGLRILIILVLARGTSIISTSG